MSQTIEANAQWLSRDPERRIGAARKNRPLL
jgi:hypothetical protein